MLLVTVSITLQPQSQQQQQQQHQPDLSLPRPCLRLSGQQRVQLLTGLAQLAGVSKLAVGITQVKQQQQHVKLASAAAGAAAGVATLTCTVSAAVSRSCCILLDGVPLQNGFQHCMHTMCAAAHLDSVTHI
jgi:hypothetical protein